MSLMDFGLYQGLSAKIPYDQMIDQQLELSKVRRQTRVDAENKSKVLTDDMKFATMSSDYLRTQLGEFYTGHMKKMGNYVIENPDLFTNPVKMAQYQMMKHEMIDNPLVAADMRYKTMSENLTKTLAENPDMANDPDIIRMLDERENYNNYGTITPGKGQKEFVFINPDTKVDLLGEIQKHYGQLGYDDINFVPGDPTGGTYSKVSEDSMYNAGKGFVNLNPKFARVVRKQMEQLPDEVKKGYTNADGTLDYAAWVKDQGKPWKPKDIYAPGKLKQGGSGSGDGSGGDGTQVHDYYRELKQTASDPNKVDSWVSGNPNGLSNALIDKGRGINVVNMPKLLKADGSLFTWSNEDQIPAITDSGKNVTQRNKYASPTGEIKMDKEGHLQAKWNVTMPMDEFLAQYPEYSEAIDKGNGWGLGFGFNGWGKSNARRMDDKSWSDTKGSSVFNVVQIPDPNGKDGKMVDAVTFSFQSQVEDYNNQDNAISSAYNAGINGITKAAGVFDNSQQAPKAGQTYTIALPDGRRISGHYNEQGQQVVDVAE